MRMTPYEERQHFAPWVYLLLAGTMAIVLAVVFLVDMGGQANLVRIIAASHIPLMLVILNLLFVVTRVSGEEVYARLGWLFPLFWTRIRIDDIVESRAVKYRPLRDASGWGMRFGRFEGAGCRYFNARGDRGVLIQTNKRRYIIGSQDPERLRAAIEQAQASRER